MKPFTFLSSLLCSFILLALFSCEKEYSVENGILTGGGTKSGTALFAFAGGNGNCTSPVIAGTYTPSVTTTSANTATLQVTVTQAGTYILSTDEANGVSFSASGSFTGTGMQAVVLKASGTPVDPGIYNYIIGTNGCSFTIDYKTSTTSNTATYTFASAPNACNAADIKINGTYTAGTVLSAANSVLINVNVTKTGSYALNTVTANGISFSGSGTFTSTGTNTVKLTGIGTPVSSGSFLFSPSNNGCAYTITVSPSATSSSDFIKCKINGVATTFNDMASGTQSTTAAAPPAPATVTVDIAGNVSAGANENISLSLNKMGTSISSGEVYDANSYSAGRLYIVSYDDSNANSFSAVSGTSQTPFTITVTNKTASRIEGTFSGTVSDTGASGGATIVITEGTFSVPLK